MSLSLVGEEVDDMKSLEVVVMGMEMESSVLSDSGHDDKAERWWVWVLGQSSMKCLRE